MNEMPEEIYELIKYLPYEDFEVNEYVESLSKTIQANYEKSEYQFAYFAVHLIFMTYIYCAVWKIARFHKERYEDTLLFTRPYNKSETDLKDMKSVFSYSHLPEKDIFKFFMLIGLDDGYIGNILKLIDTRNEMAHATGKIQIYTLKDFENAVKEIMSIAERINNQMTSTIKNWYHNILVDFSKGKFIEEDTRNIINPYDLIDKLMMVDYSLSAKELFVCCQTGISKYGDRGKHTQEVDRL